MGRNFSTQSARQTFLGVLNGSLELEAAIDPPPKRLSDMRGRDRTATKRLLACEVAIKWTPCTPRRNVEIYRFGRVFGRAWLLLPPYPQFVCTIV